jgi:1L-myo-inositol 1-phosphate cytidylyltransferase
MAPPGSTSKNLVTDAVILMAGSGSRLRAIGNTLPKPLIQISERPVFSYTIESLKKAGIRTVHVVTGSNSDALLAGLKSLVPAGMQLHAIYNPDWHKQNGLSVLAAAAHVRSPFLLTMGDHVFESSIVALAIHNAEPNALNVAVDRKLRAIFDLDDAMKLKTSGDRVVTIGKDLTDYDAIDTGLFVCPPEIFKYLEQAKREGDCSLADGVRAMAADEKVRAIDIGEAWWQDVDTPAMLAEAEKAMRSLNERGSTIGTRDTAVS